MNTCVIIFNRQISDGHFVIAASTDGTIGSAAPGQFIMVRVEGRDKPFLPRPFCIHSIYKKDGKQVIEILFKVVGEGTEIISRLREGDRLNVTGPLGHGFEIRRDVKRIALVAGGMGVAPLMMLAERYCSLCGEEGPEIVCYIGAASAPFLIGLERLEELCSEIRISTDDGSRGYKGRVTALFETDIDKYKEDAAVYACGPTPMLKAMGGLMLKYDIPCQVSLEERMACGIGACLGCAVKMMTDDGSIEYKRVCKEGPVFDIEEIDWS